MLKKLNFLFFILLVHFSNVEASEYRNIDDELAFLKSKVDTGNRIGEFCAKLVPEDVNEKIIKEEIEKYSLVHKKFSKYSISALKGRFEKNISHPVIESLNKEIEKYYSTLSQERLFGIHQVFSSELFDWNSISDYEHYLEFTTFIYNQNMARYGYWLGISDKGAFWHSAVSKKNSYLS